MTNTADAISWQNPGLASQSHRDPIRLDLEEQVRALQEEKLMLQNQNNRLKEELDNLAVERNSRRLVYEYLRSIFPELRRGGDLEDVAPLTLQLKYDSITDALMGIFNKSYFERQFPDEFGKAKTGNDLSLLFIDLDNLKQLNDEHGHPAADKVLQAVASTAKNTFGKDAVIAKYGGDELVAAIQADKIKAYYLAERFRHSVRGIKSDKPATVSIGICPYFSATDAHGMVELANDAMRRAKRAGKNITCIYSPQSE